MKKYLFLLAVLFALASVCAVSADLIFNVDGDWTAWEPDLSDAAAMECVLAEPFLENEENKEILGEVTEGDWSIGPEDAVLTLLEYADFQCPYCSQAGLAALSFQKTHPDEVRYVYRHFPLTFHEKAPMAAYAADAAGQQGFFFNVESWLYETQSEWTYLPTLDDFDAWIRENISAVIPELDMEKWAADYESEEIRSVVDASFDKVAATGIINGTPTFFANFYPVSLSPETLELYISLFKLQKNYRTECPVIAVEQGKSYRAILHTTAGDAVIDLFAEQAPNLVSNFMLLAKDGWYNGNTFHNVVKGFAVQSGDPSASGIGLAGYYLADENLNQECFNIPGAVAMANTGEGKNSSQFFIADDLEAYYRDAAVKQLGEELTEEELSAKVASKLDAMNAKYSVFGRLSEDSMDILPLIDTTTVINSIDIEVRG